jgi:hypothetical protein
VSRSEITREDMVQLQEASAYPEQAARQMGLTRTTIFRAEDRLGVKLRRAVPGEGLYVNHREIVQDMKPLDAVNYLLEVLENFLVPPTDAGWSFPSVKLTPQQRIVVRALAEARGRALSRDALHSALMSSRIGEKEPDTRLVDVQISRLRRACSHLPFKVVTIWGVGWRIDAHPGFVWPWQIAE